MFFRDGVSEGEYSQVAEKEIPAIQGIASAFACGCIFDADTCISAGIDDAWRAAKVQQAKPKLTFIVVGKRYGCSFRRQRNADSFMIITS